MVTAPLVVVTGERGSPSTGGADSAAFATVLRPGDEAYRAVGVPELLRRVVGVDVRGFGGLGGFATVSIRGSTSEQVQIFLDGVLLNRASSGAVNLADIPLPQLERIEVYRGLTPARFGAAGPGGVINLVSRSGGATESGTFSTSVGSFGTAEFAMSHGGPHSRGDYFVSVYGQRSDGDFLFLDNNGTPLNPTDDEVVRRRNNAFASAGGLAKTTLELGAAGVLRASVDGMARTGGVPGIDALQSTTASMDSRRVTTKLDHEASWLDQKLRLYSSAFLTYVRDGFTDRGGELGLAPRETVATTLTPGVSARLSAIPSSTQVLTSLLEYRHDSGEARSATLGRDAQTRVGRHSFALTAEDELSLFGGVLLLNPSVRLDLLQNTLEGQFSQDARHLELSGKLGVRLALGEHLTLRGNVGRFFRAPTLTELFGDTGLVRGNPALRPELGYTFDAGLSFHRRFAAPSVVRRVFAEAVYFQTHFDDLILFVLQSQGIAVAQNLAAAQVRGVELQAAVDFGFGLALQGTYTWQRALSEAGDRLDGKLLPGRPQHKVSARLQLEQGPLRFFYELLVIDGNFVDRLNQVALEARVLHGAGVAWKALPQLTLSFEAQNFTDNRIVDLYRFPLPGRSFFGKLSASF